MAIRNLRDSETLCLGNLVPSYLSAIDVMPKSVETYNKALRQFIHFLDRSGITMPGKEDIVAFKNEVIAADNSPATVNLYLIAVRRFFLWLEEQGLYANVAAGIKGARTSRGFKKGTLTLEQIRIVLKGIDRTTIEGKRNYAIINLLVRTGLRTIELHRANIEDIRQEAGESLLYIQGKGQESKDSFVLLTEDALRPIREYLNARKERSERKPLFASHSNRNAGDRLSEQTISRVVKGALRAVGIDEKRLTAHSLRHTAITLSLLGGASLQEAQAMARHRDINTTLIYAHNIQRIKQAPERKIACLLNGV